MPPGTDRIDRSGSHAVLIGVSTYQDPGFPSVPAAGNSLQGVHRMLVGDELGGWPDDQVIAIPDPVDCRRVMSDLRRHAQNTSGVLLLYFVGHGTVTTNGDLVLAVSDTIANEPDVTGLEYSKIRSVLRDSPAQVKAVVLDCCYSGRAIDVLAGDQQHLADITDVRGTYTLTAADRTAHAGQADTYTAFTGELLDLIGAGVVGGPPVLTFAELYPHLRHRLIARNLPHPNQRGTDTADKCPVAKNAASNTLTAGPTAPPTLLRALDHATHVAPPAQRRRPGERPEAPLPRRGIHRRTMILGTLAVGVVGAAAGASVMFWPESDKFTNQPASVVAFSPDGRTLASVEATSSALRLWDVATGDTINVLSDQDSLSSVAFSPDGKILATGGFHDVRLRDARTGVTTVKLNTPQTESDFSSVTFSIDGKTLATGGDEGGVQLWRVATGRTITTLNRQERSVRSVAFSPDGKTLAGSDWVYIDGKVVGCWLWDVATGRTTVTLIKEPTYSVAFSPDGKSLATGGDGGVRLWDVATGHSITTFIGGITYSVVFSPDGRSLATGGEGGVRLWDVATGRTTHTVTNNVTDSVAFSPDGKVLARGTAFHGVDGPDAGIWLWKLQ
ncbi:caspase family protein [Streptomyces sp. NPDC086549]|uniref:caspase, EACC1-associated type n=1 Tax=Streptomyces sp. NPDC086549 TaxID=3365752 RepID=UPI00382DB673